jgi:Ca2+-binding RTX toxin-like protein
MTTLDYALFAHDAYQIHKEGTSFNGATVLTKSDKSSDNNPSGFYGVAYLIGNEVIISYRGTETDTQTDSLVGWPIGGGAYFSAQATEAVAFYNTVKNSSEAEGKDIVFTGHSLGGGLAGFMASLTGEDAVVFDNMPFEFAAKMVTILNELSSKLNMSFADGPSYGSVVNAIGETANTFGLEIRLAEDGKANIAIPIDDMFQNLSYIAASLTGGDDIEKAALKFLDILSALNGASTSAEKSLAVKAVLDTVGFDFQITDGADGTTYASIETSDFIEMFTSGSALSLAGTMPSPSASELLQNISNVDAIAVEGEVLSHVRSVLGQDQGVEYLSPFFGGEEHSGFYDMLSLSATKAAGATIGNLFQGRVGTLLDLDLAKVAHGAIDAYDSEKELTNKHTQSLLILNQFLEDTSVVGIDKADVGFLGGALYTHFFAGNIASNLQSASGHSAAKVLGKIANTAAKADSNGAGQTNGDTAIYALFNDATDVGTILPGAKYDFELGIEAADYMVRGAAAGSIVQFSSELAVSSNADDSMKQGFVRSDVQNKLISLDYSSTLWNAAAATSNYDVTNIEGREYLIDRFGYDDYFRYSITHSKLNVGDAIEELFGDKSTNVFERIHFVNKQNAVAGVNLDLDSINQDFLLNNQTFGSDAGKADIVAGTDYTDRILGSDRNEIIDGGAGSDVLFGGAGDDILVASDGNNDIDYVDGGAGEDWVVFQRDLNDYHIIALDDSHEYEFVVKELTFVQNPFTPPSFTGNEVYLKDIQYGQFDNNIIYQFGEDGPLETEQSDLKDSLGEQIGVISIEAPTYAVDSNIEFNLNLSTSGTGTQYKVALIIDISGSMGGSRISEAKAAYVDLINYLKDQGIAGVTEFAVIPFNSSSTLYQGLSADDAIARINTLYASGGTSFGPAIQRGRVFFGEQSEGITNIAYFLSDGQGYGASTSLQDIADVRAFGIGSGASIGSLNIIDSNNAVILNSASDLAASFTESEIKTADVDKIEIYLNGTLAKEISGDELIDNGATGLGFSGTIDGLSPSNADTLEAKVVFKDASIPVQSVVFNVGDGVTEVAGTDGDDNIAFSLSQTSLDAGAGTDNINANALDNTIIKISGGGVIKLHGGNDNAQLGGVESTPQPALALSKTVDVSVAPLAFTAQAATVGNRENIVLDGGDGTDTVTYTGNFSAYNIEIAGGLIKVSWSTGVTDSLSNVEFIQFDDVKIRTSDLTTVQIISANPAEVIESGTGSQITFTVNLDAASSSNVTFDYTTINGTAEVGRDFTATNGTVTFAAGETQKTITVDVTGDAVFESDETFALQLSNANGAVFDGGNATYDVIGTIKNDDDANQVETGSTGDDVINTGKGNDQINSGAGNDVVNANLGNDIVIDGLGSNTLNGEGGADALITFSGNNTQNGGADSDYLAGGFQSDNLNGGSGNDVLRGDLGTFLSGSDVLNGGEGNDFLMGAGGADTFVFNTNDGTDTIAKFDVADLNYGPLSGYTATATGSDFEVGVDHVQLTGFTTVEASNVMASITDGANGAVFDAEGTNITFFGITANQLTADDFLFV